MWFQLFCVLFPYDGRSRTAHRWRDRRGWSAELRRSVLKALSLVHRDRFEGCDLGDARKCPPSATAHGHQDRIGLPKKHPAMGIKARTAGPVSLDAAGALLRCRSEEEAAGDINMLLDTSASGRCSTN